MPLWYVRWKSSESEIGNDEYFYEGAHSGVCRESPSPQQTHGPIYKL
jgi:hypothetical protein